MNIGWIKLHRQFKDWEWYNKSEMVHLFIHCLIKSNFKSGNFQGMEVEKGSFITSIKHLSDETNISIQTIRTCLKKLQLTNEINVKSTSKLTKITICKYESYQYENDEANKHLTNNQQTTNKQLTTIEERKERKEEKEEVYRKVKHLSLSLGEFKKLNEVYEKSSIDDILDKIENYSKNKNYSSLYLTANAWLKKDGVKIESQKPKKNYSYEELMNLEK